jgi:hypothetical protein
MRELGREEGAAEEEPGRGGGGLARDEGGG